MKKVIKTEEERTADAVRKALTEVKKAEARANKVRNARGRAASSSLAGARKLLELSIERLQPLDPYRLAKRTKK